MKRNRIIGGGLIAVLILAFITVFFGSSAQAAEAKCGTAAQKAVFKTVTTPGVDAVYKEVKVIDQAFVPATPGTPAVYKDVKVIDVVAVPPTPPIEEVSHIEHRLVTPGTPEVAEVSHEECTTLYHVAKFTQTRTKSADVWQNFSPNKDQDKLTSPPAWPSDPRGTWQHMNKPIPAGHAGPDGVYQKGTGAASWFYRSAGVWSDYGPWTKWSPESHADWVTSPDPIGSPAPHASGTYSDGTKWERQWQVRWDGQTKKVDCHKVIDVEYQPAVPPVYKDVKVIDQEYVPGTPGVEEVSHVEHQLVTPEVPGTPEVAEKSHMEKVLVTPAVAETSKQVLVSKAVAATKPCVVTVVDKPQSPPMTPTLAYTGPSEMEPLLKWSLILLLAGAVSIAVGRKLRPSA